MFVRIKCDNFCSRFSKGPGHGKAQILDIITSAFSTHHKHLEGRKCLLFYSVLYSIGLSLMPGTWPILNNCFTKV